MRHLLGNKNAQMGVVSAAIGLLITLIVVVLVFYNIAGSIDTAELENDMRAAVGVTYGTTNESKAAYNATTPVSNGTNNVLDQAATFFTIAPIIVIVIVAVVVIGYVKSIGG